MYHSQNYMSMTRKESYIVLINEINEFIWLMNLYNFFVNKVTIQVHIFFPTFFHPKIFYKDIKFCRTFYKLLKYFLLIFLKFTNQFILIVFFFKYFWPLFFKQNLIKSHLSQVLFNT